jgi:hypothetical protein
LHLQQLFEAMNTFNVHASGAMVLQFYVVWANLGEAQQPLFERAEECHGPDTPAR